MPAASQASRQNRAEGRRGDKILRRQISSLGLGYWRPFLLSRISSATAPLLRFT